MAGELWLQFFQVGKEATSGTAVPATRKLYGKGNLTRVRPPHLIQVSTGTRDNQRDAKLRSVQAGGKFTQPLGQEELLELLGATLQGGVAPTTSLGASTWNYAPSATLDSQTWEWFDGQRGWQLRGALVDQLKLSGDVKADTTVEATLFGRELVTSAMTGSLTSRTPDFKEGWEVQLFIDAFGATPGTTNIAGTLRKWDVTIANKAMRNYFGDNTTATGSVVLGELDVKADLYFEANASALAEFVNWDAATKRLVQLKLGNNGAVLGTSTLKPQVNLNMPGAWTAVDLTPEDNTKVYKMSLDYVYDPTNAYGIQVQCINGRTTAY